MASHSRPLRLLGAAALMLALAPAAYGQQTAGNIDGRIVDQQSAPVPGATVTASNGQTGFSRSAVSDSEGLYRLSALPIGTYDLKVDLSGFSGLERKNLTVSVGQTLTIDVTLQVAQVAESVDVSGHVAARRGQRLLCRRRRRRAEHREPAAQRPAVREPGGDDPGRWPRLPQRPDQEHAVLAADRRRQRPQRQLSDRRRRQQRRYRRRPPAALPARGDPGVQLPDRTLQGRVRPQQRRRDEHRHEERHEPVSGQLVHDVPRQVDERADGDREAERRGQAGLPTLAVRRIVRRTDRPEPGALLRGGGAHAARHEAEPSTRWDCFRARTASSPRPSARTW